MEHHPDHPLLFDPEEDLSISRRMLFDIDTDEAIFKRPDAHSKLCPPVLLLAGIKKKCKNVNKT